MHAGANKCYSCWVIYGPVTVHSLRALAPSCRPDLLQLLLIYQSVIATLVSGSNGGAVPVPAEPPSGCCGYYYFCAARSIPAIPFLPRCMECNAVLTMRFLSVRLSVRLSNAWIVTKRKKNLSGFLFHAKDHSVYFYEKKNVWWGATPSI